ncbi:MAG: hypothetical protein NTV24_02875 [Candidatus Woesebacteria bacterium]|nr:hypothetical protein [Candidatus Woesebacteria bacterium]
MITRFAVRKKNHDKFIKVISLRKQGHSYGEIMKLIPVAKSTINNWITLVGLNLSQEHLQIQTKKRLENHVIATEASRITRARNKDLIIQRFIQEIKGYLNDGLFVSGIMLYEAEGSKGVNNGFSNSDFRLITAYIRFLEKYFYLDKEINMRFRLHIHDTRKADLNKIKYFWSKKMGVKPDLIKITWKHNIVSKARENPDYVGQMNVHVSGVSYFTSKILAISDIILRKIQRMNVL